MVEKAVKLGLEAYLDNSATTKVRPEVAELVLQTMENDFGNPSSLHSLGHRAEQRIKIARRQVADVLGVPDSELFFTSGGTESNNLAIIGACMAMRKPGEIITTSIEHKSVLECFRFLAEKGFVVRYLDVDENAAVDVAQLRELLGERTCLVSIGHVNSEVGSIQPVEDIARLVRRTSPQALFHVDAVQSFGKLAIPLHFVDMLSVSAHKIGGPKGVGALYVRKGVKLKPLLYGGGQEKGVRSGTENVPAIVGFGKAAELADGAACYDRVLQLKNVLAKGLVSQTDGVLVNSPEDGSPYILNVSVCGFRSELLLHALEQRGVYVSSGSACASRRPQPSHVLTAMGLPREQVDSTLRFSLSPETTMEQIEFAVAAFADVVRANASIRK